MRKRILMLVLLAGLALATGVLAHQAATAADCQMSGACCGQCG